MIGSYLLLVESILRVQLRDDSGVDIQGSTPHPFTADEFVRYLSQLAGRSLNQDHFQRLLAFEENMERADDFRDILVFDLRQALLQIITPVLVNNIDRPGRHLVAQVLGMLRHLLVDHGRDRLGSALKASPFDHFIQLPHKAARHGEADSFDGLTHTLHKLSVAILRTILFFKQLVIPTGQN